MRQLLGMSKSHGVVRFAQLAERIALDIKSRSLKPGDPYMTTAEIARQFRVSGTTANRALQLLTQRGVLDRRQRSGTFIADLDGNGPTVGGIRRVHLLVQENYMRTEGLLADGLLLGMQGAMPGAQFQFNFLPGMDEAEFVGGLMTRALRSREPEGFVLFRTTIEAQRLVRSSGLPAVVYGSLHPSVEGLPQIDRDQRQAGALLAGYLLKQGVQRVAVLLRDRVSPGDHQLLDGALGVFQEAGLGLADVVIRCLPADAIAVEYAAREQLTESKRLTGFLCRSTPLAEGAAAAAKAIGGRRQPLVCVADVYRKDDSDFPFAHVRSTLAPEEAGAEVGRVLLAQVGPKKPPCERRAIPVELVVPESPGTAK
jgi:hypothetical protein